MTLKQLFNLHFDILDWFRRHEQTILDVVVFVGTLLTLVYLKGCRYT